MNWKDLKKFSASTQAIKKANEETNNKIQRTMELLQKYNNNKVAMENAKRSTPCIRAMRQYMRAVKNASDPKTPFERVKELLDAKIAADPINKVQSILAARNARKQASEVKVTVQPAKKVEQETALKTPPDAQKALKGNEEPAANRAEGKTVTFSDGRTVTFPAKDTTPVKSASDRVNPMVASIKAALAKRKQNKK